MIKRIYVKPSLVKSAVTLQSVTSAPSISNPILIDIG